LGVKLVISLEQTLHKYKPYCEPLQALDQEALQKRLQSCTSKAPEVRPHKWRSPM